SMRHVLDVRDVEPKLFEVHRRAAAGDGLEAQVDEAAGELVEAGLVVGGDQRAHRSLATCGSRRCSAACTRARSVSTVSSACTGTDSTAITGPVSIPSST